MINETAEPFSLFDAWYQQAQRTEPEDPNAMALATATPEGAPSVRMVLLKGADSRGFVFYTNTESRKGAELATNPQAALCLHWKSLRRQVRVEGRVDPVSAEEADAYFNTRARDSRLGAWASEQSRPLDRRETLKARMHDIDARYPGEDIPRPPHWSGFRLVPHRVEFWLDQPFRLHDRLVFERDGDSWRSFRLFP
jgi:pyridoxamine 5'-phosphate oxidase